MNIYTYDAIVIGTGAAGYNAACRLKQDGRKSVCIVTEGVNIGTSRNTGSDKQTYYKLGLSGDSPDSVRKMAENLFEGGAVDGDNALSEAALSVRCFMNLVELGVLFPHNRYGEYIGYKTDHDPFERATSAGPLTSKFMTEVLEKKANELQIEVFDGLLAVEILTDENGVEGLVCINVSNGEPCVFQSPNVILATGGPAGIYADSVYPECHTGSTGLGLSAGAALQNMTEWQYGLASINPRWNVSGTYMQVLPRFVSVDEIGDEYEFLTDFFEDKYEALSAVFLKGYQWPFDSKKVLSGSSVIDLLVYRECVLKNRRVYLDYTKNPFGLTDIDYEKLSEEAYTYLKKAGALFGTPIERLKKMNAPAIELYKGKGLDITEKYLEIALCAQHNNGGFAVDKWWQTSVPGMFAVGECAGTHGVARPGGSALNAGQVGSLRAAQFVSVSNRKPLDKDEFLKLSKSAVERVKQFNMCVLNNADNCAETLNTVRRKMSDCAAALRDTAKMSDLKTQNEQLLKTFVFEVGVKTKENLYMAYKLRDTLLTQNATLTAMLDFAKVQGATRGSSLNYDPEGDLRDGLEEMFRFTPDRSSKFDQIQEIHPLNSGFEAVWRLVRPIPDNDDFFENVWATYRKNSNIY